MIGKYMKKILIGVVFFLASCKSICTTSGPIQTTPDTLSKPTETVVAKDTIAEIPKGTWVKTDPEQTTQVSLEEDTIVYIKPEVKKEEVTSDLKPVAVEKPQEILLPKNSQVILPPNTYLQTSDPAKVLIDAKTEVVLPQGTEITITRINWYAILFYCLLAFGVAWYYLQGRNEDKDGDGFVDETKQEVKKEEPKP